MVLQAGRLWDQICKVSAKHLSTGSFQKPWMVIAQDRHPLGCVPCPALSWKLIGKCIETGDSMALWP